MLLFFDKNTAGNLAEKLIMLPVFIAGVAFTCYLIQYRKATLSNLIFTEAILISGFSIVGSICCDKADTPSSVFISLTASFAIIGMAIQNTYMCKVLNQCAPKTVMTGNFTQFSIDFFNLSAYFLKKDQRPDKDAIQPVYNSFKKLLLYCQVFKWLFFGLLTRKQNWLDMLLATCHHFIMGKDENRIKWVV